VGDIERGVCGGEVDDADDEDDEDVDDEAGLSCNGGIFCGTGECRLRWEVDVWRRST